MRVHIDGNKLVITTEPKTICLDLRKKIDNSLNYEIDYVIKQ